MANKYLDYNGLSTYDATFKNWVKNLLKPSLLSTAISSSNKFTFSNVNKNGIGLFTFGNTTTFINLYGLTSGATYKQVGTFVYDGSGSVKTTTINVKKNANNTLEIWSGDNNYAIVNGYTAYLFIIPLY